MTVGILIQIDKLVQLLESPVFTCTYFNTQLSHPPSNTGQALIYISHQLSDSNYSSLKNILISSSPCTAS
jgi:hypothetical protein